MELADVLPRTEFYNQLHRVNELADVLPRTEFYNQLHRVNELADVFSGTEFYNQLHRINDSRDMADFQLALDDRCCFLKIAGCTFPVRELTYKRKIISACVQCR